jgi:hypothetical protein
VAIPNNKESIMNLYSEIKVGDLFMLDIWDSYKVSSEFLNNEEFYLDHDVSQYDRWDLLAEKYYGNRSLMWVLMLVNNIEDPFSIYFDYAVPSSLKKIKIIKNNALQTLLQRIRNKRLNDDYNMKVEL